MRLTQIYLRFSWATGQSPPAGVTKGSSDFISVLTFTDAILISIKSASLNLVVGNGGGGEEKSIPHQAIESVTQIILVQCDVAKANAHTI